MIQEMNSWISRYNLDLMQIRLCDQLQAQLEPREYDPIALSNQICHLVSGSSHRDWIQSHN